MTDNNEIEFYTNEAVTPADRSEMKASAERQVQATFARVFSTHDGKAVLEAIAGFVEARHYRPNPPDPSGSLQRESRRSVYWWIEEMVRRGRGIDGTADF